MGGKGASGFSAASCNESESSQYFDISTSMFRCLPIRQICVPGTVVLSHGRRVESEDPRIVATYPIPALVLSHVKYRRPAASPQPNGRERERECTDLIYPAYIYMCIYPILYIFHRHDLEGLPTRPGNALYLCRLGM